VIIPTTSPACRIHGVDHQIVKSRLSISGYCATSALARFAGISLGCVEVGDFRHRIFDVEIKGLVRAKKH